MHRFIKKTLCGVPFLVSACGGDDSSGTPVPGVDCGSSSVPSFAEVSAFDVCVNCHNSGLSGPDRNGAPSSYNFDLYSSASEHSEEIVKQVSSGFMPPASSGFSLTEAQKKQLYTWGECGAPE